MSLSSTKYNILKPNKHNINNDKLNEWLNKSDKSIKEIALEFIMKTTYISYNTFVNVLKKCVNEMLLNIKSNVLQFYMASDDINYKYKSSYWIIMHIKTFIDMNKYTIKIVDKIDNLDLNNTVILADDASYSGSQISNFLEEFSNLKCNIYILIPFISNTSINLITLSFKENNINGDLYFVNKNKYIMKPIFELMDNNKIIKLFKYYTKDGNNIREYPIYFDHKVADSYSSFPLIYSYGVIPNEYNKKIIIECKEKRMPLKDVFNTLERVVFLNNCYEDYIFDILRPSCPSQPYKENFIKKSSKKSSNRISL